MSGKGKASARLVTRLRWERVVCGHGKMPAGSAALVRRGRIRVAGDAGHWCIRLNKKKKRSR